MNDSVKDGVGYCRITNHVIPVGRWVLRGYDNGFPFMPVLDNFEQDGTFPGWCRQEDVSKWTEPRKSDKRLSGFFVFPGVGKCSQWYFLFFPMLGKPIFADFLFSQCWESQFSLIFDFLPWRKVDFRRFLIFPREGKLIFADFWFSPVAESRFSSIFDFPPWGKADFRQFLIFSRGGKSIFADFWFSPVRESRFSSIFARRTPTKASFSRFSFIVPLRKLLFADFRSSYPYESFFLPIFVHRTPTKASFSRFSFVVPLRKPPFPVFYQLYPVSEWFFAKIDDLRPYLSSFSYWAVSDCWFSKRHLCFDTASSAVCIACICVLFHYSLELVSKSEVRVRMRNFQAFRVLLYNVASVCCKILRETGRQEEHLSSH